jgi:uncharacterized membrane protein
MKLSRAALAAFFSFTGVLHFVRPKPYEAIVPPPFPKRESVAISGVAEIVGAVAVLHPGTRGAGRWWLIGLLLAIFPANVWMAVSPEKVPGLNLEKIPRWMLWARLPLQPLAILWVWRATERQLGEP